MAGEKGYWRSLYLRFDKESGERMEAEAAEALEKAGVSAAEQFEQTMQAGGRKAANTLARNLRDQFNTTIAQAKVNLARGLIDPRQFREIETAAKRTFNEGILGGMDRLRAEGKTSEAQLQRLARQLKDVGVEGKRGADAASGGLERLRKFALSAAGAVAGVFAVRRLKDFALAMFEIGTDAEETASKFVTTFGPATEQVQAFVDQFGTLAGLNREAAQEFTATAGAIVQGMGASKEASAEFSERMIRLAADLQSFHNVPIEETFVALKSGLIGQFQPMDRFGVVVRQNDVNLRALQMTGKRTADELTQLEKAQASLTLMLERAGPALNDTERTQDSLSNRSRRLRAEFENVRIELAQALIPAFEKIIRTVDEGRWAEKAGIAVRTLADNLGELVALTVNFAKALLVSGAVAGVVRLTTAIKWAEIATKGWLVTTRTALAAMGPAGWFVLGVTVLTGAFQKLGASARKARQEQQDYIASLATMSKDELDAEIAILAAQRKQVEAQMGRATSEGVRAQLKQQLDDIRAAGLEAIRLRNEMMRAVGTPAPATTEGPTAAEKKAAEERIKKLWAHLETWRRSQQAFDAVTGMATYGPEEGVPLTEEGKKRFEEEQRRRRQALEQGMVLDKVVVRSALAEWETLTRAQIDFLTNLESVADQVAYNIASAFQSTFQLMHKEGVTVGNFLEGILRGLAGAALASVSQWAQVKVKENVAAAIEAGARAFGFLALGNFASQGAALASAGQHMAAAAAWGALSGGAGAASGGVTGGRGAVPVATRDAGLSTAKGAQQRGPEVHIYIDPLDPSRPAYQRNVYAAQQMAKERYGEDANVVIHPHSGGGG